MGPNGVNRAGPFDGFPDLRKSSLNAGDASIRKVFWNESKVVRWDTCRHQDWCDCS